MLLNEEWFAENIVEEKYLKLLKRNYPQHQLFNDTVQNLDKATFFNPEHLAQMKTALRLIRAGYNKYNRSGVLKSRTIRSLIEVMSFE